VTLISTKPDAAYAMVSGASRTDFASRVQARLRVLQARVEQRDAVIEVVRGVKYVARPSAGGDLARVESRRMDSRALLGRRGAGRRWRTDRVR
jgi:hypothetical protein